MLCGEAHQRNGKWHSRKFLYFYVSVSYNWGLSNGWKFPLLWYCAMLVKKHFRVWRRNHSKIYETQPNRKTSMSTSCFELLTCEECWRFHHFLKWCPLSAFLPLSGRASQYSREALQKAEFPLWFCHWHPALLFPLQSCQILSAVWKQHVLAGRFPFHLEKVSYAIRCARPGGLRIGSESCMSWCQSPSHPFMVPLLPLPVCPLKLPALSASAPRTSKLSSSFSDQSG